MFPSNNYLNQEDGDRAEALGLKDHLLPDIHIGGGGAVETAEKLFSQHTNWSMGAINCETNAGIHTMQRANQEGGDLIDFFNQFIPSTSSDPGSRIKARTASFCTQWPTPSGFIVAARVRQPALPLPALCLLAVLTEPN